MSNIDTFGAEPLLEVAIQCGAVQLQSACITELLLENVENAQDKMIYQPSDDDMFSGKIQHLLGHHLDEDVKKKLHEAIGLLLFWVLHSGRITYKVTDDIEKVSKIRRIMNSE